MQLDQGDKGFSFSKEGPLDMRMDPTTDLTAREIINRWPEKELGELFRDLGEEPRWKRAAKAIVDARKRKKIETTTQLAEVIASTLSPLRGKWHPATLIFQALRMCVNRELDGVAEGISKAVHYLAPRGRIGVISFHSLEDRIVKNIFRVGSAEPKKGDAVKVPPILRLLTKKPLAPLVNEIRKNPRARSAKLRFAERI